MKVNREALKERARTLYTIPDPIDATAYGCLSADCKVHYELLDGDYRLNKSVHEIPVTERYSILSCAIGLNGIHKLLTHIENGNAILEVHFFNRHAFESILAGGASDACELFPISGGQRLIAGTGEGQVKVIKVEDAGAEYTVLNLTVEPVGDYSTYTLSVGHLFELDIDPVFSKLDFKFRPACFSIECDPEREKPPAPRNNPVIDYLAKDYDSFKHTMIAAMMQRVPDWQPSSEADLDMVLIELFSAAADELSDYQDRVMNEAYLATARKRVSIARHARLMDYHIHQGNQASTWLVLRVSDEGTIVQDFVVSTGMDIGHPESIIFKSRRRREESPGKIVVDPLTVYPLCNNLGLYTWSHSVPTLAAGSTSADLQLLQYSSVGSGELEKVTGFAEVEAFKNLVVNGAIHSLLIQERLNPATGREVGRNPEKRQLLRLLPGEQGAEVLYDPLNGSYLIRVHWRKEDALKADYCFYVECDKNRPVENVSLFHGNLLEVFHGRPVEVAFKKEGTEKRFLFTLPVTPDPGSPDSFLMNLRARLTTIGITLAPNVDIEISSDAEGKWLIRDTLLNELYLVESNGTELDISEWFSRKYLDYSRTERREAVCKLPPDPLAYRETPTGGEVWPVSSLEVDIETRNSKDRWDEVISLVHSTGSDEGGDHFVVETDEYGQSMLRFGNGRNGMELPEQAVVHCSWQTGAGPDGNIGADSLTAFDESVYGFIIDCWNPFDVTNGRAPEPVEEIIRNAPEAYRSRQLRAVTLKDYVQRAEELEGVSRAAARYAWTGSWRTVQITIDPVGATELSPELRQRISRHLEAVRLIGEDLEIRGPVFVPLDIAITLCIHPDFWIEDVRSCLKEEFSESYTSDGRMGFFHPDRWTFGQPLWASEMIGRIQRVEGVDHVKEVLMKRWNDPASPTDRVTQVGPNEIIRVRNSPDFSEDGYIVFDIKGGRGNEG